MPVVSNAACTSTTVTQTFSVSSSPFALTLTGSTVSFGDCDGKDLAAYYEERFPGKSIKGYVAGSCPKLPPQLLNAGYRRQKDKKWLPVIGGGTLAYPPSMSDSAFRNHVNDGLKLIKRQCLKCQESHMNIYYKRLTPIPNNLDLLQYLIDHWFDDNGNKFNQDFSLYSTYEDAIQGKNEWKFCNFNDRGIGFPRDCGPTSFTPNQWNKIPNGAQRDVLFFVEA